MNKLVSKDPILRFKLGRKIIKAQNGRIITSKGKEESIGTYNRIVHNGKWTWGQFDNNGLFVPITKETTLGDGTILNVNGSRSSVQARKLSTPMVNKEITENPKSVTTQSSNPYYYTKGYGDITKSLNLNNRDAVRKYQRDLISKGLLELGLDDGIWGDNTQQAYVKSLVKFTVPTEINDLGIEKAKEIVIPQTTTPNFGYRTDVDYTNRNFGSALKNLSIRNYNGLVNYVKANPDEAFSRDLTQMFGDVNAWNKQRVESGLGGISGNYGVRDRRRFGNTMATQAGTWNGAYDAREQASRTGYDGTVYSNSRVRDLFDNVQVRSPYDFSNMKFTTSFRLGGRLISKDPVKRFKLKFQYK